MWIEQSSHDLFLGKNTIAANASILSGPFCDFSSAPGSEFEPYDVNSYLNRSSTIKNVHVHIDYK